MRALLSADSIFRFFLNLAFKNLWRHKRRMILTTIAIAAGIWVLIIFDSLISGMREDMLQSLFDFNAGHFQVVSPEDTAAKKPDLKHLILDGNQVVGKLQTVPWVKSVAPRLLFAASLINGGEELPVIGIGVDPELDRKMFKIASATRGRWIRKGELAAALGIRAAELLHLKVGDVVTLRTRTKTNTLQAVDLTIVGLIDSTNINVNSSELFLPLDSAARILGTGQAVSTVMVNVVDFNFLNQVMTRIRKIDFQGGKLRIKPWQEAAASVLANIEQKRFIEYLLVVLIGGIAGIGVVNSILLASLERVREIGVLKAMGMNESEIIGLFICEAAGLGLIGGTLGMVVSVAVNLQLVNVGVDMQKMYGPAFHGMKFYGVWNPQIIGLAFCSGIVIAILAGWLPARKAAQTDPAISLRKL